MSTAKKQIQKIVEGKRASSVVKEADDAEKDTSAINKDIQFVLDHYLDASGRLHTMKMSLNNIGDRKGTALVDKMINDLNKSINTLGELHKSFK